MTVHIDDRPQMIAPAPLVPVIPIVTNDDLRGWMQRMKLTYDTAAEILGVDRSCYATWVKGVSRYTNKPLPLPRSVQLAAMAIEMGLHKKLPPPQVRKKGRRSRPEQLQQEVDNAVALD